jgi:hypothetical protein
MKIIRRWEGVKIAGLSETKQYAEDKINEFQRNSNNENMRGLHRGSYTFKKDYKAKTHLVRDESDLLVQPYNILNE